MHEQCDKESEGESDGGDEGESLLGRQLFPNCWFSEPRAFVGRSGRRMRMEGRGEEGRRKKRLPALLPSSPPSPLPKSCAQTLFVWNCYESQQ